MNKIITAGSIVLAAAAALAMPNKKELAKAQRLVEDVTAADLKALKAGKKTAKEVAETHMQLAEKAENQAEKYLLYQGAFRLYARNEEYDRAADALQAISRDVDDVPPELIIEIVSKEMRRVAGKKAPRILTIFKQAKRTAKYRKEIVTVEVGLKAKPYDTELNRKYGECLAELGRWKEAIAAFAKSAGEVSKIAAGEKDGKLPPQHCADFWWDYGGETDDFTTYKVHAAHLYKKAMADTAFEGLARTRAEQRVKEVTDDQILVDSTRIHNKELEQLVFALSDKEKLEFLKCPAGRFTMGCGTEKQTGLEVSGGREKHLVKITRPFYLMKYPLTWGQYKTFKIGEKGNWRPVEMQKKLGGDRAPANCNWGVICRELTRRFADRIPNGYIFRAPTEAEWEYALRANGENARNQDLVGYELHCWKTTNDYGKIAVSHDDVCALWGKNIGDWETPGITVGAKLPNAWGFYDMVGNGREQMLDHPDVTEFRNGSAWRYSMRYDMKEEVDPVHGLDNPDQKAPCLLRGYAQVGDCICAKHYHWDCRAMTIRLCIGPDLVSEWNEKHKTRK